MFAELQTVGIAYRPRLFFFNVIKGHVDFMPGTKRATWSSAGLWCCRDTTHLTPSTPFVCAAYLPSILPLSNACGGDRDLVHPYEPIAIPLNSLIIPMYHPHHTCTTPVRR